MRVGVEIPIHEASIFYLDSTSADNFLEQYPPRIFFIGGQLVESFPVPFDLSGGGEDAFFLQAGGDCSQTAAAEVLIEDPADSGGFIGIDGQLSIGPTS